MSDHYVVLPESARISGIDELRQLLIEAEPIGTAIQIDAAQLGGIDGAAMQLLIAYAAHQRSVGRTIEWAGVPEMLFRDARLFGAEETLGLKK